MKLPFLRSKPTYLVLQVGLLLLFFLSASAQDRSWQQLLTKEELLSNRNLLGGVYCAYPGPQQQQFTPAPEGYTPFYISHYGRHGSRYQPNDTRYFNTRQRLREANACKALTPLGKSLLKRIEILCDSCLGHGGLLTSVGARQHHDIAMRMYGRFPEVFAPGKHISARASVVKRCGQSMDAFLSGLDEATGSVQSSSCVSGLSGSVQSSSAALLSRPVLNVTAETDSIYMAYIAYDSPAMRKLAAKNAPWQSDYDYFKRTHVNIKPIINRIFKPHNLKTPKPHNLKTPKPQNLPIDSLQTVIDLYWLTVGMQNLDLPFTLDDIFTPEELFACWQCVNYRMYVCNGNAIMSDGIPPLSASSLLRNIVESADYAMGEGRDCATLRFGHDSNLLRLAALMRLHNCANAIASSSDAWRVWQECSISPMAANIQLIFYRNAEGNVLLKILLNENEVTLDVPTIQRVQGIYYRWHDLRQFFLSQASATSEHTDFLEPVQ